MKKLLIISIIFLFKITTSFGSPNGKGLMCECLINCGGMISSDNITLFFNENSIKIKRFNIIRNSLKIFDDELKYSIPNSNIILIGNSEFHYFILYRKTLKLFYNNPTIEDDLKPIFKCTVFEKNIFYRKQSELIKKLERRVNEPFLDERDNKI